MRVPSVAAPAHAVPDWDAIGAEFEERRRAAMAKSDARKLPAIGGTVALAAFALAFVLGGSVPALALGVLPIAGFAAYRWHRAPRRAYLAAVKDEAFPAAIRQLGPDWRFARRGALDLGDLKAFSILPGYDKAKQQDLITGTWDGIGVSIVEAKLIDERGSGKDRRDVTVFRGIVATFRLPDAYPGRLIVRRRFGGAPLFSGLERVRLETSDFERDFNVYADDQVVARVLLTVTVMERLRALSEDLRRLGGGAPAERLEASFAGDRLLVLVPCNADLFEARGETREGHVARDVARLIAEVRDVLRIAEALRLAR